MKSIYLFSGLGADHRVFSNIQLSGYKSVYIKWLPNQKGEAINDYARRLLPQITTNRPILIGLSFGGIIAAEVAKLISVETLILLASVKTRSELPPAVRRSWLPLHRWLPGWVLIRPNFVLNWFFGTESEHDRRLLANILRDTDPHFLKWALDQITKWQNIHVHPATVHIHGTKDRLFPIKYLSSVIPVEDGGHFMTVNKAPEVTALIMGALNGQTQ